MTSDRGRWPAAAAALLALGALWLPLWRCTFSAPQYPGEPIRVALSASGLTGDFDELGHVDQYIGVHVPTTLPGIDLLPKAVWAMAALLLAAAFAPGRAGVWLRRAAAVALVLGLLAAVAFGQWQLWLIGHHRDPHSPIARVKDFTPLVLGMTRVGNFRVLALPGLGGWLLAAAAAAAAFAGFAPRAARLEASHG